MANFELSEDAKRRQAEAQAEQDRLRNTREAAGRAVGPGAVTVASPDDIMRHNAAEQAKWNAEADNQAQRAGVETAAATANAGGISGFFGGKEQTQHFTAGRTDDQNYAANKAMVAAQLAGRTAQPMATMGGGAQINQGTSDQMRAQQMALAADLAAMGRGEGPSAAQAQLQAGADMASANALGLARSGRGNPGVAMKQALAAQGQLGQQAAAQSAMLRAQESQTARAQLAGVLSGTREQDIGLATGQAGFTQDAAKANLAAQISQQDQLDKMTQFYVSQGLSLDQAKHQAGLQQAQFNAELLARQAAADKGVAMQSSAQAGQMAGQTAAAIAGTIASAASDERVKTNITDGSQAIAEFLGALSVNRYEYKEPDKPLRGSGVFVSPMAQDIERTDLGRHMVSELPDGTKIVDYGKGFGLLLAIIVDQHKRLSKLEAA